MSVSLWTAGVFGLNLLLGVVLIISVFRFVERQVSLGAVTGILAGTGEISREEVDIEETIEDDGKDVDIGSMDIEDSQPSI